MPPSPARPTRGSNRGGLGRCRARGYRGWTGSSRKSRRAATGEARNARRERRRDTASRRVAETTNRDRTRDSTRDRRFGRCSSVNRGRRSSSRRASDRARCVAMRIARSEGRIGSDLLPSGLLSGLEAVMQDGLQHGGPRPSRMFGAAGKPGGESFACETNHPFAVTSTGRAAASDGVRIRARTGAEAVGERTAGCWAEGVEGAVVDAGDRRVSEGGELAHPPPRRVLTVERGGEESVPSSDRTGARYRGGSAGAESLVHPRRSGPTRAEAGTTARLLRHRRRRRRERVVARLRRIGKGARSRRARSSSRLKRDTEARRRRGRSGGRSAARRGSLIERLPSRPHRVRCARADAPGLRTGLRGWAADANLSAGLPPPRRDSTSRRARPGHRWRPADQATEGVGTGCRRGGRYARSDGLGACSGDRARVALVGALPPS